jgi:hypothetical protein
MSFSMALLSMTGAWTGPHGRVNPPRFAALHPDRLRPRGRAPPATARLAAGGRASPRGAWCPNARCNAPGVPPPCGARCPFIHTALPGRAALTGVMLLAYLRLSPGCWKHPRARHGTPECRRDAPDVARPPAWPGSPQPIPLQALTRTADTHAHTRHCVSGRGWRSWMREKKQQPGRPGQ